MKNITGARSIALKKSLINVQSRALAETTIGMAIVVITPMLLAHTPGNQFIVGPIVNAVLIYLALRVGVGNAIMIAVIPSLIALFRGMLPPTAAALIPFIVMGNITLVSVFGYLKGSLIKRVTLSAIAKTLVIALPVWIGFNIAPVVKLMMSWPQLVTALAGGAIVIGINAYLSRNKEVKA